MTQASGHAFDWLAFACSLHVVLRAGIVFFTATTTTTQYIQILTL
jgi:hypothetical protein